MYSYVTLTSNISSHVFYYWTIFFICPFSNCIFGNNVMKICKLLCTFIRAVLQRLFFRLEMTSLEWLKFLYIIWALVLKLQAGIFLVKIGFCVQERKFSKSICSKYKSICSKYKSTGGEVWCVGSLPFTPWNQSKHQFLMF